MQPLCNWALQCKTDFLFDSYTINESKNLHKILKKCKEVKNNKQGMVLSWGVWFPFRVRWFHLFQSVVLLASLSVFKQREGPGSREDHLSLNMVDAIDDPIDYLGEIAFERFYVIEAVRESLCRFQFSKRIVQHDTHTSTRHGTYRKGKWGGPTWMMLRYFLSLPLWRFFC